MAQSFDKEAIVNEQQLQHDPDARTGRSISELTLEELGLPPGVSGFKGEEAIIDETHRDYEVNEAELLANRAVDLVQQRFGEELPPGFPLVKTSRQMREGMSLEDLYAREWRQYAMHKNAMRDYPFKFSKQLHHVEQRLTQLEQHVVEKLESFGRLLESDHVRKLGQHVQALETKIHRLETMLREGQQEDHDWDLGPEEQPVDDYDDKNPW